RESIANASYPEYVEAYTIEESFEYPVSFNGKLRFKITLPKSLSPKETEAAVLADPMTERYLQGGTPKKVIVVPSKIINIVV
ncbi:MAG: leucine--tRNA ligase, partial [Bacteroidales bacterium]|nr:leucine--tRNA ligase [Bacteroidales bacterium]